MCGFKSRRVLQFAGVAQLAARILGKDEVAGSIPAARAMMRETMDTPLSQISKTEYIHSDEHLLGALRRFKVLRTYPAARDRSQVALHAKMVELETKRRVVRVCADGNTVQWRMAV